MVSARVLLARHETFVVPRWPPLRRVLRQILLDHSLEGTLSVALVTDDAICAIHEDYLGKATPTDVISFPLGHEEDGVPVSEKLIGEVVVSGETALREAKRRKLDPERELALYAIHGTLHLAGFDDLESQKKRVMRRAEKKYLALYDAAVAEL